VLFEQLHLPAVAELAFFQGQRSSKNGEALEAVVQFTPEQYAAYVRTLNDPSVWTWEPFDFNGAEIVGPPEADALRWWSASGATIASPNVASWATWGFFHGKSIKGKPSIWDVGPHQSFCFGADGEGVQQRVARCTAFPQYERPRTYLRALLDERDQRLFVYID